MENISSAVSASALFSGRSGRSDLPALILACQSSLAVVHVSIAMQKRSPGRTFVYGLRSPLSLLFLRHLFYICLGVDERSRRDCHPISAYGVHNWVIHDVQHVFKGRHTLPAPLALHPFLGKLLNRRH